MILKFNLTPEKLESVWPRIKEAINGKGRNLKFGLKSSASPKTIRKNQPLESNKENQEKL